MLSFLVLQVGCAEPESSAALGPMAPYLPDAERMASVPVFGGTLESAPAVGGLVAADPEGDRLLRAVGNEVAGLDLGDNARPFRVYVEDTQAWVTLRGTGELASVSLLTMELQWATRVCLDPRGVARSPTGPLVVACAGGELVEVGDDGAVQRFAVLDSDLRDVVVMDDRLFVSRFATAAVLNVDPASLVITKRSVLGDTAGVAWRMRAFDDRVVVLHQTAASRPIHLSGFDVNEPASYGSDDGSGCPDTIVDTVLTHVSPDGTPFFDTALDDVTVGTDFVITEGEVVAIANAGARDVDPVGPIDGPGPHFTSDADVLVYAGPFSHGGCRQATQFHVLTTPGRASALAIAVDGTIAIQSAAPFSLARLVDGGVLISDPPDETADVVRLFHADAGVGVSCASCHPEGLDDGHVWTFVTDRESVLRRTMPLAGQLLSRLPYHWDAAHHDPHALMEDTFVARMGGAPLDSETTTALFEWLDELRHVRAHPAAPESAIEIGRGAFLSAGCADCHAGSAFTTNFVEPIGRAAEAVKVPSLLGVGVRNELFHDGCAADLDERFDGTCELLALTVSHGEIDSLTVAEIEALKAYLRTL